jgi:hypothetical protein
MIERPSLSELRSRVFKHSAGSLPDGVPSAEIGNWLARYVGRPLAVYGTWLAIRGGLSAHQITLAATAAGLGSAVAIASGTRWGFLLGVALAHIAYWFDHVDGQVARWRRTSSLGGVYFDYVMHHAITMALGFALGYGLAARSGDPRWAVAGFLLGAGWTFLGLNNDCRYKAFFQRLKRDTHTFRVDGGAGERPAPPSPWPRHGIGVLTWPLYKACEPHTALLGITLLGLVLACAPTLGFALWRDSVRLMAILAPTLAVARVARTILRDTVQTEFDRWFRLWEDP